jgi:hypothetical protein
VPDGSGQPGHATIADCRDWLDRPEQQRPQVESFWLDQAAPHASMSGVLNDGVRGASWGASRKKAVGEVFGGGLPTKSSKNNQTQCLYPVILA